MQDHPTTDKTTFYMGRDQYGQTFHNLGKHPRKELLQRLGYKKASPMYVDKKDGRTVRTGYVIGQHWITLYSVQPVEVQP